MSKPIDFCPNCNGKRELDVSLGQAASSDTGGAEDILLYHFHCASCNAYIRSTTLDYEAYLRPVDLPVLALPVYVW